MQTSCLGSWVLSFGLLSAIGLAGCGTAAVAQPEHRGGGQNSLEVVQAGKAVRKSLVLVTTQPARIEALEQTPIHSKLAAYVGEVLVDYGDKVSKDQPLVKLVAPEIDAELAQKNALVEQARAEQVQAESSLKAAQAAIASAESLVAQAEARLERTQADVHLWQLKSKRFEDLANSGSLNQQLVEETEQGHRAAQAAHKEAKSAIDATKAAVRQSEAQAAKAAADITTSRARVQVAQANVAQVEALLSYLTIKSPLNGVVTRRQVDPGHLVQPAGGDATTLLIVARTDKVRVFAAVPETEAAYVDLGDEVTVEVQSLRREEFKCSVSRTSFALDAGNRALETIMDIDNAAGRLRPGMYATARVTLAERKDVLTLPTAALVRQANEAYCYRLIDGHAVKTPLVLGIRVGDDFEVTSGLRDSDTVILNKASALKDGQTVEPAKTPVVTK